MAEPCWQEAGGNSLLPPARPTAPAGISQGAHGVQLRMLPLCQHRGFPRPGSPRGTGETTHTHPVHVLGRWEVLPGEPGPVPAPRSAASSRQPPRSPPPPALAGLASAATDQKQKAFDRERGFEKGTELPPGHERSLCRSRRRRAGGMLLPAGGVPPPRISSRSPQTPSHPLPVPPVPKAPLGGLLLPHSAPRHGQHRPWGRGRTGVPGAGVGTSHLPQLSPIPVGTLPNLPLNGM